MSAALKKSVHVHLARDIPRVLAIKDTAFDQADVGGAGQEGHHDDGVNGVQAGAPSDGLQHTGDLALEPARFSVLIVRFGRAKLSRDQICRHFVWCGFGGVVRMRWNRRSAGRNPGEEAVGGNSRVYTEAGLSLRMGQWHEGEVASTARRWDRRSSAVGVSP